MDESLEVLLSLNASGAFDASLLERFEREGLPLQTLLAEGEGLWKRLGFSEKVCVKLKGLFQRGWAKREEERCRSLGIEILSFLNPAYPESLRNLQDPPLVLYKWGTAPLTEKVTAVVGTRRCSVYGKEVSFSFGKACAREEWVVVSGGAVGIDAAAHAGCLEGRGKTWAVLGTGVDRVFPAVNESLFSRIREEGALLSEYPLGNPGTPWHFPRRNRIIAGLSQAVVVVEAPLKSGAMLTARLALEAGRDVWAVPGRINEEVCAGSNRLLFDGAYPLVDFVDYLGPGSKGQRFLFEENGESDVPLEGEEKTVLTFLRERGDRTVDNLVVEGRMSAATIMKALSLLSAKGLAYVSGPGRWSATAKGC